jgi:hypothetical protein
MIKSCLADIIVSRVDECLLGTASSVFPISLYRSR